MIRVFLPVTFLRLSGGVWVGFVGQLLARVLAVRACDLAWIGGELRLGKWASGPLLVQSTKTCPTMGWSRWSASAWSITDGNR